MSAPHKTCATCRKPKPLTAFGPTKQTRDGLRYVCRECAYDCYAAWKERRLAMRPRLTLWRVPETRLVRRIAVTSARVAGGRGEGVA